MLFFDFNEKPANILLVMDDAKRRQATAVASYQRELRILLWLLPAGLVFLVLDPVLGYGTATFTLVAFAAWAAALVGWFTLRKERLGISDEPTKPSSALGCLGITLFILLVFGGPFALATGFYKVLLTYWPQVIVLLIGLFAALAVISLYRRPSPTGPIFGSKFEAAHTIFQTLRDDPAPRRTVVGWLDLTGAQQPGKLVRESVSASQMPIKYYRDEWLRMKLPLYDGNLVRISAIERVKARQGRWKRGSSGKNKWKAGGTPQRTNLVRVVVAVDPRTHTITPLSNGKIGKFLVEVPPYTDSRLELRANTSAAVDAWDILTLVHAAYEHVKPCESPAQPAQ